MPNPQPDSAGSGVACRGDGVMPLPAAPYSWRPLRIGILSHLKYPIREPFAGGLEMHTHLLARALRDRGHDVTVFASAQSDPSLGLEAICDATALAQVGSAEAHDVAFFKEHHAYLALMKSLRQRPFDVIHNNSLHYLPVSMAETLPMPMVTTLHTPPFCWLESGVRLCNAPNHSFAAVSRSVADLWNHVAVTDQVILNGIDLDKFAFIPEAGSSPYLVWYGRIVPEKGLHLAIEAAKLIGLPLRIAGPILNKNYFETRIRPYLGRDAIHVGHLDHGALARLIGGARAFLCTPMWDEPYGLVVAESLACGVPVAAFGRGAIPEILDDSCGVLAMPDNVNSLAQAGRAAIVLNREDCRRRAELTCDARRMIDSYEALYLRRIAANDTTAEFAETAPLLHA